MGRAELEPAPEAESQFTAWGDRLRPAKLSRIFHAPDQLSKLTARNIARQLSIPAKALDALVEVDLGLWAGLTEEELKKRYAKAHRQLVDSPLNVSPPSGEDFSHAADRLRTCLKKRIKPNGKEAIGLVMRPFTFAMVRYVLEGGEPVSIWETSQSEVEPIVMECAGVPEPVASA